MYEHLYHIIYIRKQLLDLQVSPLNTVIKSKHISQDNKVTKAILCGSCIHHNETNYKSFNSYSQNRTKRTYFKNVLKMFKIGVMGQSSCWYFFDIVWSGVWYPQAIIATADAIYVNRQTLLVIYHCKQNIYKGEMLSLVQYVQDNTGTAHKVGSIYICIYQPRASKILAYILFIFTLQIGTKISSQNLQVRMGIAIQCPRNCTYN